MNKKTLNYWSLKNIFRVLIISLVVFPLYAFAQQETGQIIGTVTDPNGAVIPNASVTVRSVDRGNEITVQTSSEGGYVVPNLQPGLYDVVVRAQGFQDKTERTQVTVGAKLTVNTQLGVTGAGGNVVDVVAGGVAEINTTDQQISNVVTTKQILELPTLTRNPYDLVGLSGNISDADPNGSTGRGVGASINGQRSSSTDILLDGVENVDTFVAGIAQQTPLDSVGEFRVITSNFSAEYGRASGGIVNATTKAGTNEYHGTLYEFNRNSKFASNSFENNARGNQKGQFNRNQFGYSIGGPLPFLHFGEGGPVWTSGKNKLFFFNSTEWTRIRSQNVATVLVPTQTLINASNINTQNFFNQYGTLAGNVRAVQTIPCSAIFNPNPPPPAVPSTYCKDKFGANGVNFPLLQQVSFSVPADAGGGFPTNNYTTVTRVDLNATDKTQIFGRYAYSNYKPFSGNYSTSPYQGFTVGTTSLNQNILGSVTHQFTSNLISQTKVAYSTVTDKNTVGADPNTPTLTGNFGNSFGEGVFFPGFLSTAPGVGLPTSGTQHLAQINEDVTFIRGNHNFRLGGQFVYIRDNKVFPAFQNALETLGTNSGQVITSLLTGTIRNFQAAINPQGKFPGQTITTPVSPPNFGRSNRYREYAAYANDSWRIRPRITVNLGVRYEYYGVQHNADPSLDSNFYLGSGSTLAQQVANGSVQLASSKGGLWKPDKNNFAPRLGVAWDVFGDGKTSVRGGYGMAYERNFGNVTFNVIQNPPNYAVLGITPAVFGGPIPIYTNSVGPLGGTGLSKTLPVVTLRAVDQNIRNAYTHFWSAGVEHQVLRDTIASITYSGSAGRDLYSIANLNRQNTALRFLGTTTSCPNLPTVTRLNCQYGNINFRGNQGYSNYHGVTFALDSNNLFGIGLTTTNRYTYSVSKDNLSSTFSDGYQSNFALGFVDPYNPSLDYGYSDFDIRHRFVSSFIYDVPFAKKFENGLVRNVLGGFQLTGIFHIQSGAPFTVYDCTNASQTTCIRLVPTGSISFGQPNTYTSTGNPNSFIFTDLSNQTPSAYNDANLYPNANPGTEAGPFPSNMVRRNSFRGPGFWNLDFGLYKNITVTERFRIQLRGEAFNVFNHSNYSINTGTLDISGSPYVTASKVGNRNLQFAAKFIF